MLTEVGNEELIVERRGSILVMTINRPQTKNAINGSVSQGIAEATDLLDDDPTLSGGVLTGAGGTFSSGMDPKGLRADSHPVVDGRGVGGITKPRAE